MSRPPSEKIRDNPLWLLKIKEKLEQGRKYAQRKAWEYTGGKMVTAYKNRRNSISYI